MMAKEEDECDILFSLFLELYQLDEVSYGVIEDGDDGGTDVGRRHSEMHSLVSYGVARKSWTRSGAT